MRNRYGDFCYKCGKWVPPGFGFFQRQRFDGVSKWKVQCVKCCDGRDVKKTDPEVQRARRLRRECRH